MTGHAGLDVNIVVSTVEARKAFEGLAAAVAKAMEAIARLPHPAHWSLVRLFTDRPRAVRRCAVECYGIPESDIRRVERDGVVLWNRRRVEIDTDRWFQRMGLGVFLEMP